MSAGTIAIVFSDSSLGGTSRSALLAGQAWAQQGYRVTFVPLLPIHPDRVWSFSAVGEIAEVEEADLAHVNAVHLHHGAWSAERLQHVRALIRSNAEAEQMPPLITNNIFAVRDAVLDEWRGVKALGVLGRWAAEQHMLANLMTHARRLPWTVGNAQDTAFFRPPLQEEREDARAALGLRNEKVILRVGSPSEAKWSGHYTRLVAAAEEATVVLVGAPPSLRKALSRVRNVRVVSPIANDEDLRQFYWASDVFSINAARGESFGNVILEALLTGLPVVYRARPYRDNTPWQLNGLQGFHYATTDNKWVSMTLKTAKEASVQRQLVLAHRPSLVAEYSLEGVGRVLREILAAAEAAEPGTEYVWPFPSASRPKVMDRARISVGHNPLIALAKEARLRFRS